MLCFALSPGFYILTRQVRSRLNGQILELIAADVTEWLPRYCLPSTIARVQTSENRHCKVCYCFVSFFRGRGGGGGGAEWQPSPRPLPRVSSYVA